MSLCFIFLNTNLRECKSPRFAQVIKGSINRLNSFARLWVVLIFLCVISEDARFAIIAFLCEREDKPNFLMVLRCLIDNVISPFSLQQILQHPFRNEVLH